MTRDELIAAVPVYQIADSRLGVVALSEIPAPWGGQFFIALAGRRSPGVVKNHGPCAYAEDWTRWVQGQLSIPPADLDDGEQR